MDTLFGRWLNKKAPEIKKEIEPDPGELVQSWDSDSAIEDVYFTDKEVSRISYPPNSGRNHITVWKTAGPFLRTGLTSVQLLDIAFDPEKDLNAAKWEEIHASPCLWQSSTFVLYFARTRKGLSTLPNDCKANSEIDSVKPLAKARTHIRHQS